MGPSSCPADAATSQPCDRRELLQRVARLAAACVAGPVTLAQAESPLAVRHYAPSLLVDSFGQPFKAGSLADGEAHIFNYPYRTTPVFLIGLPREAPAVALRDARQQAYQSLPGAGPRRRIVAYSAICAHKLMYPTPAISFINLRQGGPGEPAQVVHCCGDNSRYDATQGGKVISGPAPQPLAMIVLEWDASSDQLHAVGTVGGEMFQAFFAKYEFRLNLDHGPRALEPSAATTVVQTAARYSRQHQSCAA